MNRSALNIFIVQVIIVILSLTACSDRPFGYIISPLETSQANNGNNLRTTPKQKPTKIPADISNTSYINEPYYLGDILSFSTDNERFVVYVNRKIFLINTGGEVVSYEISDFDISTLERYDGALVAAFETDIYVVAMDNRFLIVNSLGDVWAQDIYGTTIGDAYYLSGAVVAADPSDRFVVGQEGRLLIINSSGDVWAHDVYQDSISAAYYIGNLVVNIDNVKSITSINDKLVVVNFNGEVYEYVVTKDRLSNGNYVSGALVATNELDIYVLGENNRLLVINSLGEVWVHDYSK